MINIILANQIKKTMCEHLRELDNELKEKGVKETFRGQAWSDNCREWVYYDCIFDINAIRERYKFPTFVVTHVNYDEKSGTELGFVCVQCKDGVMGL